MTFVLGFGAMVLVGSGRDQGRRQGRQHGGPAACRGPRGTPFLGFIAAVAFATILAVVAGLTLSGAAALSHDLWVNVVRHGEADQKEQMRVARVATVALGIIAVLLGILFKGQNVAYMVSLAFAIAASGNFPALVLSIFWKRCTTEGSRLEHGDRHGRDAAADLALADDSGGLLKHRRRVVPAQESGARDDPLSFAVGVLVSLATRDDVASDWFAARRRECTWRGVNSDTATVWPGAGDWRWYAGCCSMLGADSR
jgi:cation/acetate symporter